MDKVIAQESIPDQVKSASSLSQQLTPIAVNERIQAIDVVRGFALIGIFLMNIEFFNRAVGELGLGMPAGLTGVNLIASYFISYFVVGKFWTIFSLLFGMGFAVMLTRIEGRGQSFLMPYSRRIIALAIFGTLHHILIWPGDILFSYAISASALMLILFVRPLWILLAGLVLLIPAAIFNLGAMFNLVIFFGATGFMAFFIHGERKIPIGSRQLPVFAGALAILGILMAIIGLLAWIVPALKMLKPLAIFSPLCLLLSYLVARNHEDKELRFIRLGAGLYSLLFVMMAIGGASVLLFASKDAQNTASQVNKVSQPAEFKQLPVTVEQKKMQQERVERQQENAKALLKAQEENKKEVEVLTHGTYLDAVKWRAQHFIKHAPGDFGMSALITSMFLIGFWFVRSGVMVNAQQHLALFRRLAIWGLPIGLGLGVLSSMVSTAGNPGAENDPFMLAQALMYLGNLPACLGYVSCVILMVHSHGAWSKIRVLAPFGRMALTNYLSQSIICSIAFYGYGLGYFGLGRADQMVFVFVVVICQVLFSHWWLSNFRYGPMEWLWRSITYWKIPAFKN